MRREPKVPTGMIVQPMRRRRIGKLEICWDGVVVWVESANGNLARFSRISVDVHREPREQAQIGLQCLDCRRHGDDPAESWDRFVRSVRLHYHVSIPSSARPRWLTGPENSR